MYLRTVRGETLMPSLTSSSFAILSSPQSELSRDISRIKRRSSAGIGGRPGFDFQCQRSRNPARCHRSGEFLIFGLLLSRMCIQQTMFASIQWMKLPKGFKT